MYSGWASGGIPQCVAIGGACCGPAAEIGGTICCAIGAGICWGGAAGMAGGRPGSQGCGGGCETCPVSTASVAVLHWPGPKENRLSGPQRGGAPRGRSDRAASPFFVTTSAFAWSALGPADRICWLSHIPTGTPARRAAVLACSRSSRDTPFTLQGDFAAIFAPIQNRN